MKFGLWRLEAILGISKYHLPKRLSFTLELKVNICFKNTTLASHRQMHDPAGACAVCDGFRKKSRL
jgi:hypothetical protein